MRSRSRRHSSACQAASAGSAAPSCRRAPPPSRAAWPAAGARSGRTAPRGGGAATRPVPPVGAAEVPRGAQQRLAGAASTTSSSGHTAARAPRVVLGVDARAAGSASATSRRATGTRRWRTSRHRRSAEATPLGEPPLDPRVGNGHDLRGERVRRRLGEQRRPAPDQPVSPRRPVDVKHRLTSFHCTKGSDPSRVGRRAGWRRRTSSARARRSPSASRRSCSSSTPLTGAQIDASRAVRSGSGRRRHGRARAARLPGRADHRRLRHRQRGRRRAGAPARARSPQPAPGCSAPACTRRAEGAAEITDKERYAQIRHLLGDAVADPDRRAARPRRDARRRHRDPGLQRACAATCRCCRRSAPTRRSATVATPASPRARGDDARLAALRRAARDARLRGLLLVQRAADRAADVPDYTWFWWKLRPHPRLGTVEIRALDAQTSLDDLAALVALIHCLARHAATAPGPTRRELLDEGVFRAARFGVAAELPDADGPRRPVTALLDEASRSSRPPRRAGLRGRARRAAPAPRDRRRRRRQRELHAIGGLGALLRDLTEGRLAS